MCTDRGPGMLAQLTLDMQFKFVSTKFTSGLEEGTWMIENIRRYEKVPYVLAVSPSDESCIIPLSFFEYRNKGVFWDTVD